MRRAFRITAVVVFTALAVPAVHGHAGAQPPAPANLSGMIEDRDGFPAIRLTWDEAPGNVVLYNVYRRTSPDAQPVLIGGVKTTSCADYGIEPSATYLYHVTAVEEGLAESPPSPAITLRVGEWTPVESGGFSPYLAADRVPALVPWSEERRLELRVSRGAAGAPGHLPGLLLAGELALLAGNPGAARDLLQRVNGEAAGFLGDWERGLALLLLGEGREAAQVLEEAVGRSPESGELALLLGLAALAEDRLEEAAERLEAARESFPGDPWPVSALPDVMAGAGRADDAAELLEKVVKAFPDEVRPRYDLARLYEFLKDYNAARTEYREMQELAPDDKIPARALHDLDSGFTAAGDTLDFFEDRASREPDNPQNWFHLGDARWMSGGRPDRARDAYQEAVRRDREGEDPRLYLSVADREAAAGRLDGAQTALDDGLRASPTSYLLRRAQALLAARRGDWKRAADLLGNLARDRRDPATEHVLSGWLQALAGSPARGAGEIRSFADRFPEAYWPNLLLGNSLLAAGDAEGAARYLRKAREASTSGWLASFNLAAALARWERAEEAAGILEDLTGRYPEDWLVSYNLGVFRHQLGRPEEAADAYRRSLELLPEQPDALSNLGVLVAAGGDAPGAAELFRKALEQEEDHRAAGANLGLTLYRGKKFAEAEAVWEEAVRHHPDDGTLRRWLAAARKGIGLK